MEIELSVVVLCYRSGKNIHPLVNTITDLLDKSGIAWEIILVGNYFENSRDQTPEIIKEISSRHKNTIAVTLPKKGMMGWDARSGLDQAKGDLLCLIDGDGQMPAEDILKVYHKLKLEKLSFTSTFRKKRHDGITRITVSWIYNSLFGLLFPGTGLKDINAKPKIFTRQVYKTISPQSDDWFIDAEIVIGCRKNRFKMGQVQTEFHKCVYRRSFVKPGAIFEFIKNLFNAKVKELTKK